KEVRIAGYRALRYLIADVITLEKIIKLHYEIFIMRSLAKDPRVYNDEREQVLKIIRTFADVPGGTKYIPLGVLRSIVSIAELPDEKLRNICLETLAEIMIREPKLITHGGGMRVLLQALIDGPLELSEYLMMALLYVIDMPDSRNCIRPGVDLEIVLSGFTDACNKGPKFDQRIRASSRAISVLLKSWTGIIYLCMDNKQAIRSIVESLRITSDETREIMLDMFFNIFRIKIPHWYPSFLSGKRITVYGLLTPENNNNGELPPPASSCQDRLNLLDHHLVILLDILIDAGLLDALVEIIEDKNQHNARKATLFIGEILQLSNRLLSLSRSMKIQSLPRLFSLATKFDDEIVRHSATAALSHIDNLNRTRNRFQPNIGESDDTSIGSPNRRRRNARQVENVKLKMGIQIDDVHFRNMLLETQVLSTKDYVKWNWETTMELLQGPLLNPRRLEEAIRSKFMKRLIGFFRPNSRRFSEIEKSLETERYVQLGCTLITTLLANFDGVKYLESNKFLRQISDNLNQLVPPMNTGFESEFFSKERINNTLTSGYFTMIGILSKFKDGVKDGHPRILLSKVMTSGYKRVRLYATKHLGLILRTSVQKFNEWAIQLLITQLYDPAMEVCQMAVRVLEETCNHKENIELLVKLRPSLDNLGEVGNPLLLRFLSTSIGFKYLSESDYVEKEMDDWFQSGNQYYVTQLEVSLSNALRIDGEEARSDDDDKDVKISMFDGISPAHFYGELTKTDEGCQLLREKKHFSEFANYIREHKEEKRDANIISKLKSILWAVGNIGASKSGLQFLEEEDIVKDIVYIAENSEFPQWTYKGFETAPDIHAKPIIPSTQAERDLLKAMTNLTNRILSSTGSRSLLKYDKVATPRNLQPIKYLSEETFDQLDKLMEVRNGCEGVNGVSDDTLEDGGGTEDADAQLHKQRVENFSRVHRGSDGVIAVMSDDQMDGGTEETVPKQDLLPAKIVIGFNTT
ncbi:24353_t:CDS:10, partial [Cetraspora pellucida]